MHTWYPIVVDLAEVLDRCLILRVKYDNTQDGEAKSELSSKLIELENRIVKRMGYKKYQEIIASKEYSDLYDANYEVYLGVNKAKTDPDGKIITGYQLDQLNVKRNKAKNALSMRFLGKELSEIKLDVDGKKI